jgi:hypothetical protein
MRSRQHLRRLALRCATVAAAATVGAATLAAPAGAQPVSADLPLLPKPWRVELGAASAGGTVTFRQDPLGVMGHWTVKGVITAAAGDCYYVQIAAARSWNSPPTCGPSVSAPFVVEFTQPVFAAAATARLCAARPEPDVCGASTRLW